MTLRRRPTPTWFWQASCWPACRCRWCGTPRPGVLAGLVWPSLPLPLVWHTPASGPDALVLCSLGIFGGLGHYCLVRAFELAPAPFVSPFNYAQILGAAVLSTVVFGQVLGLVQEQLTKRVEG